MAEERCKKRGRERERDDRRVCVCVCLRAGRGERRGKIENRKNKEGGIFGGMKFYLSTKKVKNSRPYVFLFY